MPTLERAIERLYSDASVRDELVDADAELLLQWGDAHVSRLVERYSDDAAFDDAYAAFARLLTRINRYVGKRAALPPEESATFAARVLESAGACGFPLAAEQWAAFVAKQTALDNASALRTLFRLLDGSISSGHAAPIERE